MNDNLNQEIENRVKEAFEQHPDVDRFHITMDGQCFERHNMAHFHARQMNDDRVLSLSRADFEEGLARFKKQKEAPKNAEAPAEPAAPATPAAPAPQPAKAKAKTTKTANK